MTSNLRTIFYFAITALLFVGCKYSNLENSTNKPKLLLISFDGFGHNYLSKTETPHFDTFIEEGVKAEGLIPVFPTKTFPNHYSIVTGLYPENHGIIANEMYDPDWERWFRINDREVVANGEWYDGEPIWNTIQKEGMKTGTMFWVGSEADIQMMRPTYWKPFDSEMPEKARIDTVIKWFSYDDDRAIQFGTLYFEFIDDAGHDFGLESDSLISAIQKADQLLGYLRDRLTERKLWDSMNIIIVSDHGMVDLSADKIIELESIIDIDTAKRIVWAPVTMITPDSGHKEQVLAQLRDNANHFTVFEKDNLPDRFHIRKHRRVPPVVMVADLGYTILSDNYKSLFLHSLPSANHGFDNRHKEMYGIYIARGPAFKSGFNTTSIKNIHLYEMMSYIMGITPAPNDGILDSVKVLLKE